MSMPCAVTADLTRHMADQERLEVEGEARDAFVDARAEEMMNNPAVVGLIAGDVWDVSGEALMFAVLQCNLTDLPMARCLLRERFLVEARKLATAEWERQS